jgi:hypothetical protein
MDRTVTGASPCPSHLAPQPPARKTRCQLRNALRDVPKHKASQALFWSNKEAGRSPMLAA